MTRSYLSVLPERYEKAKLRNIATKNLRKVAKQEGQIFEGGEEIIYTG